MLCYNDRRRRRDTTRQLSRVGVGGVYWGLRRQDGDSKQEIILGLDKQQK